MILAFFEESVHESTTIKYQLSTDITLSINYCPSGGAYGLARVTLGFFPGFMIGCCEIAEYIVYVATSALLFANVVAYVAASRMDLQPVVSFLFYVSGLSIYVFWNGRSQFWVVNTVLCVLSLFSIAIFIFGSIHFCDFNANAGYVAAISSSSSGLDRQWFVGGMSEFLRVLPLAAWFFVGIESLNFACDETDQVCVWSLLSTVLNTFVRTVTDCDTTHNDNSLRCYHLY
jgi:hypothetical protein